MPAVYGPHLAYFGTRSGVRFHIPLEVSIVFTRVHVQHVAAFVDVNQRDDVRPSIVINGADVRHLLRTQKRACVVVGHQPLDPVHVAPRVGSGSGARRIFGLLIHEPALIQSCFAH
jgi:hypothetical protein